VLDKKLKQNIKKRRHNQKKTLKRDKNNRKNEKKIFYIYCASI